MARPPDRKRATCDPAAAPPAQEGDRPGRDCSSAQPGETTTLGRSGSDTTAALLGAALGAREVVIWTDVDGVLTADPRVVPKARLLTRLSYREAAEMTYFGAKVLHFPAVLPAIAAGSARDPTLWPEGAGRRSPRRGRKTGVRQTAIPASPSTAGG
jgi:hypothetical protein